MRADGTYWYVSWSGRADWQILKKSVYQVDAIRLGDFDGNGATDVFSLTGGNWSWASGGSGPWTKLNDQLTTTVSALVFADFDGNGRTDIAQRTDDGWRYARDGRGSWQSLRTFAAADEFTNLRTMLVGNFDGRPGADALAWGPRNRFAIRSRPAGPAFIGRAEHAVRRCEMRTWLTLIVVSAAAVSVLAVGGIEGQWSTRSMRRGARAELNSRGQANSGRFRSRSASTTPTYASTRPTGATEAATPETGNFVRWSEERAPADQPSFRSARPRRDRNERSGGRPTLPRGTASAGLTTRRIAANRCGLWRHGRMACRRLVVPREPDGRWRHPSQAHGNGDEESFHLLRHGWQRGSHHAREPRHRASRRAALLLGSGWLYGDPHYHCRAQTTRAIRLQLSRRRAAMGALDSTSYRYGAHLNSLQTMDADVDLTSAVPIRW